MMNTSFGKQPSLRMQIVENKDNIDYESPMPKQAHFPNEDSPLSQAKDSENLEEFIMSGFVRSKTKRNKQQGQTGYVKMRKNQAKKQYTESPTQDQAILDLDAFLNEFDQTHKDKFKTIADSK